ncbi:unnamed protein product [Rhizoctonia solani]|uniref:Uncharacterized protein n=1 Tax=Rhizoctonia solani TaxID=456999 RepID=A0A8H2XVQ9_9AGAM|nr:unnamed protein product [Rhizoctonia solani]
MSLDINWIILIVVFTALVIEVLTAVAYVFENCWSFDKPSKAFQEFVPDAYTDARTAVTGTDSKQHLDAVQGILGPLSPLSGQRFRPPPPTTSAKSKSTPGYDLFVASVGRISSWMFTLLAMATKPKYDAGSLEVKPKVRIDATTEESLSTRRLGLREVVPNRIGSSGATVFQKAKAQTPVNTLANVSLPTFIARNGVTSVTTALPAATKVLDVPAVVKSHTPAHRSSTPGVPTWASASRRARPLVVSEYRGDNCAQASLDPFKKSNTTQLATHSVPIVPTTGTEQKISSASTTTSPLKASYPPIAVVWDAEVSPEVKKFYQDPESAKTISSPKPQTRTAHESCSTPTFTPSTEPASVIPVKRRLRAVSTRSERPTKRRRFVCPKDQDPPLPNPTSKPVDVSPTNSDSHTTQEPHFIPVTPEGPSLPIRLVPAKRRAPTRFTHLEIPQTKRRRINPSKIDELPTLLPLDGVASRQLPLSLISHRGSVLPTIPTGHDLSLLPDQDLCLSEQITHQDPSILATDLLSHLMEPTRGETKRTRTPIPTSDQSKSLATVASDPMIDTSMSSSGKPGAPSRVCLRAHVKCQVIDGEESNDLKMAVLDATATPDITMSSSTADTSISSVLLAPTSPVTTENAETLGTMEKVLDSRSLADEEDVEMDPDSLMDDGIHSGSMRQHRMPDANDQLETTRAIGGTVLMEETSAGVAPEETMGDADQEGAPEPTEEDGSALAETAGAPQQVSSLAETFAGMQVGSAPENGGSDEPDLETEHPGEQVTATEATIIHQEQEPEPVTGLGAMQVAGAEGEVDGHSETPSAPVTVPAEPVADLAQSLAGMQVGAEVAEPTALDPPHPTVGPEEYVEDPFDELIQALVVTHLPAPVIMPYESESTEIGVSDTVSGPTGSDFISLGFEDDEEEGESEGEEDEQALMDAAAAAIAWISGF